MLTFCLTHYIKKNKLYFKVENASLKFEGDIVEKNNLEF